MVIRLTQWTPSRNIEFFINCEEEGKKLKKENKKENSFPSTCKLLPEVFFNSRESFFWSNIFALILKGRVVGTSMPLEKIAVSAAA